MNPRSATSCTRLFLLAILVACAPPQPAPTPSPTPASSAAVAPTSSVAPSPTATPTRASTPTPAPPPSATPVLSGPVVKTLESQGYVPGELLRFELFGPDEGATFFTNQGQFWGNGYGGPRLKGPPRGQRLYHAAGMGRVYAYLQYVSADQQNCHLLFFVQGNGADRLLADMDVSTLNPRINRVFTSPVDALYPAPLFCLPGDWGDINRNALPDLPVTVLWANNYTGGEVHIFEVSEEERVVDLTADLPGAMSHWDFDPGNSFQMVIDLAWAEHDCIYPQSPFSFWVFDWEGAGYADHTAVGRFDFSGYLDALTSLVESRYGGPFQPDVDIGPIVSVLLMYDKMGERDRGWQEFLELTRTEHWPGTDADALRWLQDDVRHLTAQNNAGAPFTPNDYCG